MRVWCRAAVATQCGYCGKPIAVGDALQLYSMASVRRRLQRCALCAGEPVPADLAPLPTVAAVVEARAAEEPIPNRTSHDFKQRQAGDDE